jgi:hypothetical protein
MSAITLETALARLYTDEALRCKFLATPAHVAQELGLSAADAHALVHIDRAGLLMAADSYAWKRKQHRKARKSLGEMMLGWVRRQS